MTHPSVSRREAIEARLGEIVAGRFRLARILGAGGMGWVYLAVQEPLGRPVALKVLVHERTVPSFRQRFFLEASVAARLSSPHIVTIHDYGETEQGELYIAMEYVEGTPLSALLKREGPFAPDRICRLMRQVCKGLSVAHDAGVVHRDLKPSNIMLVTDRDGDESVKVLDFGLVKALAGDVVPDADLTGAGMVLGSPSYMSPEQIRRSTVDQRADIYSTGALMYRLITGQAPYRADTVVEVMNLHLNGTPPPIDQHLPNPDWAQRQLEAVAFRCLQKNPGDRYPSMDDLRAQIKAIERSLPPDPMAPPRRWSSTEARSISSSDALRAMEGSASAGSGAAGAGSVPSGRALSGVSPAAPLTGSVPAGGSGASRPASSGAHPSGLIDAPDDLPTMTSSGFVSISEVGGLPADVQVETVLRTPDDPRGSSSSAPRFGSHPSVLPTVPSGAYAGPSRTDPSSRPSFSPTPRPLVGPEPGLRYPATASASLPRRILTAVAIGAGLVCIGLVSMILSSPSRPPAVPAPPTVPTPPTGPAAQAPPAVPAANTILTLDSEPNGAKVSLEGRMLGVTPLTVSLPQTPGRTRAVMFELQGYTPVERQFGGGTRTVDIAVTLRRTAKTAPAVAPPPRVRITRNKAAKAVAKPKSVAKPMPSKAPSPKPKPSANPLRKKLKANPYD